MKKCMLFTSEVSIEQTENYVDVRAMKMLNCQLRFASNLGQKEFYQIPLQIGEEMVAVNLKFVHQNQGEQKVSISMQTDAYGVISAEFSVENRQVTGYVLCSHSEGVAYLQQKEALFVSEIRVQTELEVVSFSYVQHQEFGIQSTFVEKTTSEFSHTADFSHVASENSQRATSAELYQVAKTFIGIL